jgi:transposase
MLFCGIDVAKRKHVVVIMDDGGQVIQTAFPVKNDHQGFERLHSVLGEQSDTVTVGLEATGHYWLALYETLTARDYPVVVLNPLQVSAYRRSGLRKVKKDTSDAVWIADFVRIANVPPTSRNMPLMLQLRELTRFRYRLSEQVGDCKRKILCILDRVFPEYETVFSSVFIKSSRKLLQEAVSAHEIAELDLSELTALLQDASRGQFGAERAAAIQQAAQRSVGVRFLTDAVRVEMRCLLAQIGLLEEQMAQISDAIAELMDQIPQHITSIPGIGPVTGAAILAEIGDIHRFEGVEKLVAYAGIDPTVYQSGQFEAQKARISKRGSPYLRLALWQAATMAVRYEPELGAYYQEKREQGKHHGTVIGAVCRKLLARIYVILKEQRPYEIR